jgi:hypothetical protein
MPRNSIATDLVDAVLNAADIPAKIVAYKENLGTVEIPSNRNPDRKRSKKRCARFLRSFARSHRTRFYQLQTLDRSAPHRTPH